VYDGAAKARATPRQGFALALGQAAAKARVGPQRRPRRIMMWSMSDQRREDDPREPDADEPPPEDAGGESACYAHLLCPECGVVLDGSAHLAGCSRG
jgi:hypothetical protein